MDKHIMYQVSTLQALLMGYSRSVITVGELLEQGDTGLGTFEDVNGEMILAYGHCYQADESGNVIEAAPDTGVPFASVTKLDADRSFCLKDIGDIDSLKIIDFSVFESYMFKDGVSLSTFVSAPDFVFLKALKGTGELSASYLLMIIVAYVPVALVCFAEHVADHKNLSSVIEKDLLTDPGLSSTLMGDGVGSIAGAIFGGCPNTTYGESVGCVAITKNASVVTIIAAALGCILASFVTPFVAFIDSIPACVMGGVCIALYGFIAVSGLKMLKEVDLDDNRNLFTASVILIAGIGGLSISFGSVTITEVAAALILGILTNVMLAKSSPSSK